MKNTGVIRKIDDLGRIVIPKEIRKNLNIHNGEDVQIFIEEDKIILKKYQKMLSVKDMADKYLQKFAKLLSCDIYVIDREKVVASSDKSYIGSLIDNKILSLLNDRKLGSGTDIYFEKECVRKNYFFQPIIIDADAVGGVIAISEKEIDEKTRMVVEILNMLLSMEMY